MFVHIYLYLDEIEIQRLQNLRQSFGTTHQVIAALRDTSNCKLTITSFTNMCIMYFPCIVLTKLFFTTIVGKLKQVMVLERKHPPEINSVIGIVLQYLNEVLVYQFSHF